MATAPRRSSTTPRASLYAEDFETVLLIVARYHNDLQRQPSGWKISKLVFERLSTERQGHNRGSTPRWVARAQSNVIKEYSMFLLLRAPAFAGAILVGVVPAAVPTEPPTEIGVTIPLTQLPEPGVRVAWL